MHDTSGRMLRPGRTIACGFAIVAALALQPTLSAAEELRQYSPPVAADYPQHVLWGDLHLHTRLSADAYTLGTKNLSAEDSYRFARGEEVKSESGVPARLKRPLDFLAVTDHSEYLGAFHHARLGTPELMQSEIGKRWAGYLATGEDVRLYEDFEKSVHQSGDDAESSYALPDAFKQVVWQEVAKTADDFYEPGRFTTLIGYEWTSMIDGNNLHRVVLFRDGPERATRMVPFSAQDSQDPEDLWEVLDNYERQTGGRAIAIPHNANVSNGMMFAPTTIAGEPLTADYARRRMRFEPVFEVTQVKGDSESHQYLSPTDEFANFERWDEGNIMRTHPKEPWMFRSEYARPALQLGLQHERELGANPFKFGLIGSTDAHTALATTTEDNFFGKFKSSEPHPGRATATYAENLPIPNYKLGASGLTAVWARENTRESVFDALARKEVYATTGTRITLRFFGGWGYGGEDVLRSDFVALGYARGVPMGSNLPGRTGGGAPQFMVAAQKDPDEANLDRIQIIKGWLDAQGEAHEKIYDVALSDGRKVDRTTGKVAPVGNTVDVSDASYVNSIGDPALGAVWTDPDFDPDRPAVYYVRVIEIPTPRWTTYDAKIFGAPLPEQVPATIQERAYSSPIWYRPRDGE
jgi:hypothetical protein